MPRQPKMASLDEAVSFLRGHAATGTPVVNPYYLFAKDFKQCCDEDGMLRPDSYYGRMHEVFYNRLIGSMENVKDLWQGESEADAETLLVALLDRSYEGDTCVDEQILSDFVRCVVYWKPDSLEVYLHEE